MSELVLDRERPIRATGDMLPPAHLEADFLVRLTNGVRLGPEPAAHDRLPPAVRQMAQRSCSA